MTVNSPGLPGGISELLSLLIQWSLALAGFARPSAVLDTSLFTFTPGFQKTLSYSSLKMKTTSHFAY